jgi:hypothetical protein
MEIFYALKEATILIEQWWRHHNAHRPHSSPGHRQHEHGGKSTVRGSSRLIKISSSLFHLLLFRGLSSLCRMTDEM